MLRSAPLLLAVLASLPACGGSGDAAPPRRNLLLVTLDTTRADALSCLGGPDGATPRLDRLAARSTLFARAYSETNFTSPSHLSIFTGLRAIEHGVLSNDRTHPPDATLLAEVLTAAGYDTAGFPAIRHLARVTDRGFRTFSLVDEEQSAPQNTDRAIAWLAAPRSAPFFLWVHYFDAHSLYEPSAEDAALFYSGDPTAAPGPPLADDPYFTLKSTPSSLAPWLGATTDPAFPRAMYAAEVHAVDREFGRLLDALEASGAAANTVVLVLGDHGESLGEHGIYYDHKGLHDPQLHIPLLVHVPGFEPGRSDRLVSTLDVVPTLEDLLGVRVTPHPSGRSLFPLLQDPHADLPWRTELIHDHARNQGVAIRKDGWKLILPINPDYPLFRSGPRLYHIAEDPGEQHDLASSEPARLASLRAHLTPWLDLGVVHDDSTDLDEESLRELRALGYADE